MFLRSLSQFENSLLGFDGDQHMSNILALLNVVISEPERNGVVIPRPEALLSIFDYQKICSVLCAYRLFEVISLQAGCISRVPASSSPTSMFLPGSFGSKGELHVRQ